MKPSNLCIYLSIYPGGGGNQGSTEALLNNPPTASQEYCWEVWRRHVQDEYYLVIKHRVQRPWTLDITLNEGSHCRNPPQSCPRLGSKPVPAPHGGYSHRAAATQPCRVCVYRTTQCVSVSVSRSRESRVASLAGGLVEWCAGWRLVARPRGVSLSRSPIVAPRDFFQTTV